MAAKTIKTEIKIVIVPQVSCKNVDELIDRYYQIAEMVQSWLEKKHVPARLVYVDYEVQDVCEFCGSPLDESTCEDDGYPLCCQKAQDEWEQQHPSM